MKKVEIKTKRMVVRPMSDKETSGREKTSGRFCMLYLILYLAFWSATMAMMAGISSFIRAS